MRLSSTERPRPEAKPIGHPFAARKRRIWVVDDRGVVRRVELMNRAV
jgi:hypothetical protein